MPATSEAVIIGGGVMGCSILYNLAARGLTNTSLLERDVLGSGSTGRSSSAIRMHYSNEVHARMAWQSLDIFRNFDRIVGGECGYTQTGYLVFVGEDEVEPFRANTLMQQRVGIETSIISRQEALEIAPGFYVDDCAAIAYEPRSGHADASATGYAYAGQACISTQRVLVHSQVYGDYLDALKPQVEAITTGDPLEETVKMGPMIKESDADRVGRWIQEAVDGGARVVTGGEHHGNMHAPTIVADVEPEMRISREELFGPAVAVTPVGSIDEAIALANDTNYGLSAGLFTQNIDWAMRFAREVQAGNLMINWGAQWRADLMPYGGLKESGMGKEGPRYAIEEMTELKMVVFHL